MACRVLTYSVDDASADFTAADISYDELGCGEFTVVKSGVPGAHYKLNIVGKHNISNTLASLALASLFDIPAETIQALALPNTKEPSAVSSIKERSGERP